MEDNRVRINIVFDDKMSLVLRELKEKTRSENYTSLVTKLVGVAVYVNMSYEEGDLIVRTDSEGNAKRVLDWPNFTG